MTVPQQSYHLQEQYTELKVHLLRRGLSQRRIAKEIGISQQWLSDVLTKGWPAPHIRKKLIRKYKIPAELVKYHPSRMPGKRRCVNG